MALVDNFLGGQHGTSRLMVMQARYQQKQQEQKEQKLFAMLEGQVGGSPMVSPLGEVQLVPAGRTQSNSSNLSQNTSASSNVSLSSSMGSSLVSSLGSTGSGMAATGGKVRQMFEDRRSQINGRPPVYSKTIQTRKVGPQKGWDRSHPLDPLPVGYERKPLAQPPKTRVRGVSLERGARMTRDETDSIRRSRSNYQVDNAGQTLEVPQGSVSTLKPKSLSNLLDDNQNPMATAKKIAPRYGYNSTIRPEVNETSTRGEAADGRNFPRLNYRGRTSLSLKADSEEAASIAAAAAAEATRRLEREKAQIQAEAKRREEQLLTTIKHQQQELQRLQHAAALAEQKAKAAAAVASRPERRRRPSFNAPEDNTLKFLSDDTAPATSYPLKGWSPPATSKDTNQSTDCFSTAKVNPTRQKPALRRLNEPKGSTEPSERTQPFRKASVAAARDGLIACSLCGRNFASDRIGKHEEICAKTKAKKRKVFDVTKMRVKGTEAEQYVLPPSHHRNNQQGIAPKKPLTLGQMIQHQQEPARAPASVQKPVDQDDAKKADWRRKHESFIEAIRAAKALQKHLKAGGKASDLPPPPPSDTSDYIQCPHCTRRFSPGAADRHIPKCANIKSNKPRPA